MPWPSGKHENPRRSPFHLCATEAVQTRSNGCDLADWPTDSLPSPGDPWGRGPRVRWKGNQPLTPLWRPEAMEDGVLVTRP